MLGNESVNNLTVLPNLGTNGFMISHYSEKKTREVKANEPFQFCAEFHPFQVREVNPS